MIRNSLLYYWEVREGSEEERGVRKRGGRERENVEGKGRGGGREGGRERGM